MLQFNVLCCLMTPGLSKDIRCQVRPYFFKTSESLDQTSGHTQIELFVIAYCRFNCPQGFEFVCMGNMLTLPPQRVCSLIVCRKILKSRDGVESYKLMVECSW